MIARLHQHAWMTAEIEAVRETADAFAAAELAPHLARWREQGFVDRAAWRKAGEMGLLLPELPEEWGGSGATLAHALTVCDAFSGAEVPPSTMVHSIASHYILDYGTDEQKRQYLPKLASGEMFAAIAMTEPGAGSDLQAITTRAERQGNGYRLSGSKTFITNAHTADLIVVVAKTDPAGRARGTSLFILEPGGLDGFRRGPLLDKIGHAASDTSELFFDDVQLPASSLLGGAEGQGFVQLMSQLPYERMLIAVAAAAAIDRAVALSIEHAKQRMVFGKPLMEHQNTRFVLANCATVAHLVRTFVNDCIQRLVDGTLDETAAYMAKAWCSEQQCQVIDDCLQLFGGSGYMRDMPIGRLFADARAQRIYGGSNEVMKELIARRL
jgi:acyl-CoA dehydrogenase